jgi:hypothetical protein
MDAQSKGTSVPSDNVGVVTIAIMGKAKNRADVVEVSILSSVTSTIKINGLTIFVDIPLDAH